MARESVGPCVIIGETAWSRNRYFGPDSGVRESGNWQENRYNEVSGWVPPIAKVQIGEVCIHRNGD